MFGGLDLKFKASDKQESSSDSRVPDSTTGNSAFSFLNSSEPAAAPAPPSSSAFSFLNPTEVSAPAPTTSSESSPAPSGFSFLSSLPAKEPSEAPALSAAASSFSFLQRSPSQDATAPETSETSSLPSKPSNFSFMSSPDAGLAPSVAVGGSVDMNSTSQNAFAGAGVAFGKATIAPVTKKKRTTRARTAKVGVAANSTGVDGSPSRPSIPDIPVSATAPAPVDHAAASEASRKAEQFIHEKMVQLSGSSSTGGPQSSGSFSDSIAPIKSVDSQDEMVQAAKAAVQEAKQLEKQHRSFGGALGGLFRPRSSETSSSAVSLQLSRSSSHRPATLTPTPTQESMPSASRSSSVDNAELTPAEILQREQEEVQRAITERQLNMMKSIQKDETETSVTENYHHEPAVKPIEIIPVPSVMKKPAVTAATTAPPTKKTPTDIFNDMMANFRNKVVISMEEVTNLRKQRVKLLDERFMTLAKERLSIQEKEQAEAQQMAAAEAEDFELADRMQSIIANRERECIEYASILNSIGEAIRQLDSQKEQVVNGVSKCFQDIQTQLKDFKEKQESNDREDASELLKGFEAISKKISAEQERLEQDLKHMERDERLVEEESEELEKSISEQTGEYEKQRESAKEQLGETEKEIEELRKLLNAKQTEAAQLRTEIAGHDESILMVRVKFQRQLDRVTKKKNTIRDNREEWEMEKEANDKQKREHELKVEAYSEQLLAHDKLMDSLDTEIEMADTFASIVSKEMSFGVSEEEEDKIDDELMKLQAEVVDCEARLTERKEVLAAVNSHLSKLEEEVKSLEFLIPQYEELKKSAAARRDFKAAGKASKDAKEATSRLKDCEEELAGEAQSRKEIAEEEVRKCQAELEEKKKITHEKEKESGLAAMQRLAENVKRFVDTKKRVCGDADAHSIKGVGAYVLDGQIKLLMMEGKAYGDKYGGWDDLVSDLDAPEHELAKTGPDDSEPNVDSITELKPEAIQESEVKLPADRKNEEEVQTSTTSATKENVYREFKELTAKLKLVEEQIEVAVANEEFDTAAEYDEALQSLLLKLGELNLSEEEMEVAMSLPSNSENDLSEDVTEILCDQPAANSEVNPETGEQPPDAEENCVEDVADVEAEETSDEVIDLPEEAAEDKEGDVAADDEEDDK